MADATKELEPHQLQPANHVGSLFIKCIRYVDSSQIERTSTDSLHPSQQTLTLHNTSQHQCRVSPFKLEIVPPVFDDLPIWDKMCLAILAARKSRKVIRSIRNILSLLGIVMKKAQLW